MKISLPSFIQDEIDARSVDLEIKCINDIKNVLDRDDVLFDFVLDSNKCFRKNVRFVKNNDLLMTDEYDDELKASDELMLLIQFVGG